VEVTSGQVLCNGSLWRSAGQRLKKTSGNLTTKYE
jgi:hypothetical protein